jgi:hypothetical protein
MAQLLPGLMHCIYGGLPSLGVTCSANLSLLVVLEIKNEKKEVKNINNIILFNLNMVFLLWFGLRVFHKKSAGSTTPQVSQTSHPKRSIFLHVWCLSGR